MYIYIYTMTALNQDDVSYSWNGSRWYFFRIIVMKIRVVNYECTFREIRTTRLIKMLFKLSFVRDSWKVYNDDSTTMEHTSHRSASHRKSELHDTSFSVISRSLNWIKNTYRDLYCTKNDVGRLVTIMMIFLIFFFDVLPYINQQQILA